MKVINATDVNDALPRGLAMLRDEGTWQDSRAGRVLVLPTPLTTVYHDPRRRVLFDSARDANPFFHLFEALWILAGRKDVETLAWFNERMRDFSDNGEEFHAPYGYRLRKQSMDQVGIACGMLKENRNDRRAVLQIWSAALDLGFQGKDIPCNDMVFLRCVEDETLNGGHTHRLDITVSNRSNDAIWGAYGANAVQFSVLQEYMVAHIGCAVGKYYQVSNNFHAYESNPYLTKWIKANPFGGHAPAEEVPYASGAVETTPLVAVGETVSDFDTDLRMLFHFADSYESRAEFAHAVVATRTVFRTEFFKSTVTNMLQIHDLHKGGVVPWDTVKIPNNWRRCDWLSAGIAWINRRQVGRQE